MGLSLASEPCWADEGYPPPLSPLTHPTPGPCAFTALRLGCRAPASLSLCLSLGLVSTFKFSYTHTLKNENPQLFWKNGKRVPKSGGGSSSG